jgi:hypothetical protein
VDFDFARDAHLHQALGVGGMAMCRRFKSFACARSEKKPAEFTCSYREYTKSGPWLRKSAVLGWDGKSWIWRSGDPPTGCSVIFMESDPEPGP